MFELIIKITLAHLVGDFVLQTKNMVDDIESKNFNRNICSYTQSSTYR